MKKYVCMAAVLLSAANLFSVEMGKKPNILFFLVDELRYAPEYESEELKEWKKKNLLFQEMIASMGYVFHNHYANTCACCPSRATIHTGQYPNVHGVTQTDGIAKSADSPDMTWLPKFTVPTIGNYLREEGYRTILKGKWHVSDASIRLEDGSYLTTYDADGRRIPSMYRFYLEQDVLRDYGYEGWVGPEAHGSAPLNSGSSVPRPQEGRDVKFTEELIDALGLLEKSETPWFLMASYVDPHDIAVYGLYTSVQDITGSGWSFDVDPTLPRNLFTPEFHITFQESLVEKPQAQINYRNLYATALQPIPNLDHYHRYYYTVQKRVDQNMMKVWEKLRSSPMYENTIVVFSSDHGDLLSSHGGMFQKWYQAYQESIHVPLVITSPLFGSQHKDICDLTSHIDILPTFLDFAKADPERIRRELGKKFSLNLPLPGKSLMTIANRPAGPLQNQAIYFYTEDNPTKGPNQIDSQCRFYQAVVEPNAVESIIAYIDNDLWKITRYYSTLSRCLSKVGITNEMYNVSEDPMELKSLYSHPQYKDIQAQLLLLLNENRIQYRSVD